MKFIYVSSTYPLYLGLYLISNVNEDVHFLYSRKVYKKVFELLNLKATFVPVPSPTSYFLHPGKVKKQLRRVNDLVANSDLIFTHLQFSSFLFLLLNSKQKRDKVFYDFEPISQNKYSLKNILSNPKSYIKAFITALSFRLYYGSAVNISYYSKVFFLSIAHKHLRKLNVKFNESKMTFEELQYKVVENNQLNIPEVKNLYIGQNEINMKGDALDEKGVDQLIQSLAKSDVMVKPHPSGYPYPKSKGVVSAAIPSELMFKGISNAIISINSTTLISASHYFWNKNIEHIKIICLMNLVPILDEQTNAEIGQRMKERCKPNVIYPNSFEEFESLLKS